MDYFIMAMGQQINDCWFDSCVKLSKASPELSLGKDKGAWLNPAPSKLPLAEGE
jgi:hypothetical protein